MLRKPEEGNIMVKMVKMQKLHLKPDTQIDGSEFDIL